MCDYFWTAIVFITEKIVKNQIIRTRVTTSLLGGVVRP